jgi:hypothetical protein
LEYPSVENLSLTPSERGMGAVTVAYLHPNDVTHTWHDSFVKLIDYDLQHEQRVIRGGYIAMKCGAGGLDQGRSKAVAEFLATKDAEWLFWIDTDMGFSPDVIDRLLEVADPASRPIVGGLCFANVEAKVDGFAGFRTYPRVTIFDWVKVGGEQGFQGRRQYPPGAVVQCSGTGSACVLIHRSVFEAVAERFGPVWYQRSENASNGTLIGEDLSFCMRAAAVGAPVFVHTGVKTTHQKTFWLAEQDYWDSLDVPPAIVETSVIVPVMRRPQNAEPFMQSLRASTGMASVYAVVDHTDAETGEAWERAGALVLPFDNDALGRAGTFAEKVNHAAQEWNTADDPWLFITGDDVRFRAGWLDHAQATAAASGAMVVGTNDLGNPRVMSGEHATHMLISRAYIDEVGASWDGPGLVCHEGYRHWFVDNEIVMAAQRRGVWAMALGSKVEHLHPLWGKGEPDDVYALGQESADEDRALFQARAVAEVSR